MDSSIIAVIVSVGIARLLACVLCGMPLINVIVTMCLTYYRVMKLLGVNSGRIAHCIRPVPCVECLVASNKTRVRAVSHYTCMSYCSYAYAYVQGDVS